MKNIIFIVCFLFFNFGISAQNKYLKNVNETQRLSRNISSLFNKNKINLAFKEIKQYWPLPENELQSLEEKTIKYINILEDRFNGSIGFVRIKNEIISDFAIRETYIVKYRNSAIRLIFTFYKNDKGWIINAFKWDDSFEEEFK